MTPTACPACGYILEEATPVPGTASRPAGAPEFRPDDGDVSVCLACGSLGVFQVSPLGVTVRAASPAEVDLFLADPEIVELLKIRARVVGADLRPS